MSTAVAVPKSRRSTRQQPRVGSPRADTATSRLVSKPVPAPGETALVGLSDWDTYLRLDEALEGSGQRVRFFNGQIEIMSISTKHEFLKVAISHLIAAYCDWLGIDFQGWGSSTQRQKGMAGAEPDESFTFGLELPDKPELIVEVGLTSGGIDKIELWRALGAKEVWVWQNDRLQGFAREADDTFVPTTQSRLLAGLELSLVEEFAIVQPVSRALRGFRERLGTRG